MRIFKNTLFILIKMLANKFDFELTEESMTKVSKIAKAAEEKNLFGVIFN